MTTRHVNPARLLPPLVDLHHRRPELHADVEWWGRPPLHDVLVVGLLWGA